LKVLRTRVPMLEDDRMMAADLAAAHELIASGAVVETCGARLLPRLEAWS
jgi:histidine ammonia-lyase